MIRVRKFEVVAAIVIAFAITAGCSDPDPDPPGPTPIDPATTTTPAKPTTTAPRSQERGLATSALPANFTYRVGGWTFDVEMTSLPRLQAEKTVDATQPPGTFALTTRVRGELAGAITSTDKGRDAPPQTVIPFLEYKNYSGPDLLPAARSAQEAGCDSDFDINSKGMGGEATFGLGDDPVERSDLLYCGGIGSFASDGSLDPNVEDASATEPNAGDPLFAEAQVDGIAEFLNSASPAVYVDVVADDRDPCRFRLADQRVALVGGPCEVLGTDGQPAAASGAELMSGQVWGGGYLCGGEHVATTVTIGAVTGAQDGALVAGATFEATVKFRYTPYGREVQSGTYTVHGMATDANTITMTPGDWVDKTNVTTYLMDTFNATITRQLMDGTVTDCGSPGFGNDGPFTLSGSG